MEEIDSWLRPLEAYQAALEPWLYFQRLGLATSNEKTLMTASKAAFEKMMEIFRLYVTAPTHGWRSYIEGTPLEDRWEAVKAFVRRTREFHREALYAASGHTFWTLPNESADWLWEPRFTRNHYINRAVVAYRLLELLKRKEIGVELYPNADDGPRYQIAEDIDYPPYEELPNEYKWLVDSRALPSLEWMIFFHHVGYLTLLDSRWEVYFSEQLRDLHEDYILPRLNVEQFTDPATIQDALQAGDVECSICRMAYDPATLDEEERSSWEEEALVWTDCNHIVGKECLQAWVNSSQENHVNCPNCRSLMFDGDAIDQLPVEIQPLAERFVKAVSQVRNLDREIDQFLLDGTRHGGNFGCAPNAEHLIHELHRIAKEVNEAETAFEQMLSDGPWPLRY